MLPGFSWTFCGVLLIFLFSFQLHAQSLALPEFDSTAQAFAGTRAEQAAWLLTPVLPFGHLDAAHDSLPPILDSILHDQIDLSVAAFAAFLDSSGIAAEEIGGALTDSLSTNAHDSVARYFVIHDVSTPNYGTDTFPPNIDSASWLYNDPATWAGNARAHVFVTRTGASVAPHDLGTPWRATKFELRVLPEAVSKGLFLHCELVQPRRSAVSGPAGNDARCPNPGFTEGQYRRLAIVYLGACLRRGDALVPAFHAVLDAGIAGAHDDPQGFDLADWCTAIEAVVAEVRALRMPPPPVLQDAGTDTAEALLPPRPRQR